MNALFILFHLEGRSVTLGELEAALPPRNPRGYSMAELTKAAMSFGLRLEGVRFNKGDKPLDRPGIAFVKNENSGHFLVLRPVGVTGTMVQVIDPPSAPWITDYDRVLLAKPWTGRILLARDRWNVKTAAPLLIAAGGLILVVITFHRRLRPKRFREAVRPM